MPSDRPARAAQGDNRELSIEETDMNVRCTVRSLAAGAILTSLAAGAVTPGEPGTCANDSKLLNGGPTRIEGDGPGTWWGLVINGLLAAGFEDESEQID